MNQKEFLLQLEKVCGIKRPIFLNTTDTWEYPDKALKRAAELTASPAIGRQKLTLENSEVTELWMDIESPEGANFKPLKRLVEKIYKTLLSFNIPSQYIFIKSSGKGFHIHIFMVGIRGDLQYIQLVSAITNKITLKNGKKIHLFPKSVEHSLGIDTRSKVEKTRIREFGGRNKKHYCSLISLEELRKKRTYPTIKKPENVVYPEIILFQVTTDFIHKIHESETEGWTKSVGSSTETDFELDGELENLYKCPLIAKLAKRAKTKHHLTHPERLFILQEFSYFGEEGRQEVHKILEPCGDYSKSYTQKMIDDLLRVGRKPITCKWAQEMIGCPADCKGSGGKSPIKLAWTALTLTELHAEYRKILLLSNKDLEAIDVVLGLMLDPLIPDELCWVFLISPPSSGKTVILRSLHNKKWSIMVDSITNKSFISGKTYIDRVTQEERLVEGLLPKLKNKTLIMKELTTTLGKGKDMRMDLFGQLRAIYDEEYSAVFGTIDLAMIPEEWTHIKMGLIAGCVPYIDRYETINTILGARFLKLRLSYVNRKAATRMAMKLGGKTKAMQKKLNRKVCRFLSNLVVPKEITEIPEKYEDAIINLAEAIVQIRKPISKTSTTIGTRVYQCEDEVELATRIVKQFKRLAFMLTVVRGTNWNDGIYNTLVRVAFDTLTPSRKGIVLCLYHNNNKPMSEHAMCKKLAWGHNRVRNHVREMCYGGIIQETETLEYTINNYIYKCLRIALSITNDGAVEQGV